MKSHLPDFAPGSTHQSRCFLVLAIFVILFNVIQAHEVRITNACNQNILVGILNNPGKSLPEGGGFALNRGQTRTLRLPTAWAGRFWGRTGCDSGGRNCETGTCGGSGVQCQGTGGAPPVSLAEITFDSNTDGIDFYDISLVDGFNLRMSMTPIPGTFRFRSNNQFDCKSAGCNSDLNRSCPPELQQRGRSGGVVACKSACLAFNTDRYCCRNAFNSPQACPPFRYSRIFKAACPRAYSYAYDDATSTFTCKGNSRGASGYIIKFC